MKVRPPHQLFYCCAPVLALVAGPLLVIGVPFWTYKIITGRR